MNTINSVIKFDLHIHSNASAYKEANGIVAQSTKENLDVLFDKLNQYQVSLFAITDHNRFDADLYKAIKQKLLTDKEKYPKNALAGIEFDVQLEEEKGKCHIIAIFDANEENCDQITNGLAAVKELDKPEQVYTREEFEKILRQIALNVILIAEQRKGITNKKGGESSLSDSVENAESILKIGYFNAIEVQKNHVEGILLNDLHKFNCKIPIVSGSDCHQWSAYPKHDEKATTSFYHSQAKMLPTFKGLLMAFTSPNTRFDCEETLVEPIVKEITMRGKCLPLVSGINAIIGENGSGKTTLLELIDGNSKTPYINKLQKDNQINIRTKDGVVLKKYIQQGQIIKDYLTGKLFEDNGNSNFLPIDTNEFISVYNTYAIKLKSYIQENINRYNRKEKLKTKKFEYRDIPDNIIHFIGVSSSHKFEDFSNPHHEPCQEIENLYKKISNCQTSPYFVQYRETFSKILLLLLPIKQHVEDIYKKKEQEIHIKNVILNCINEYQQQTEELSTRQARIAMNYKKEKDEFIKCFSEVVHDSVSLNRCPDFPCPLEGFSSNKKRGFCFNSQTKFHNKDLKDEFFSYMFKKNFQTLDAIKSIHSPQKFENEAILHRSRVDGINASWDANVNRFISEFSEPIFTIIDDQGKKEIGNTLGEKSLAFYRYCTDDSGTWDLLIIDQPEDNISNNNIRNKLISYLRTISRGKQIIFVTHNPLLVVNMDVDNVIHLCMHNNNIEAISGCLEYEDENTNILQTIAESMDGGTETIERRLKVYGKGH